MAVTWGDETAKVLAPSEVAISDPIPGLPANRTYVARTEATVPANGDYWPNAIGKGETTIGGRTDMLRIMDAATAAEQVTAWETSQWASMARLCCRLPPLANLPLRRAAGLP